MSQYYTTSSAAEPGSMLPSSARSSSNTNPPSSGLTNNERVAMLKKQQLQLTILVGAGAGAKKKKKNKPHGEHDFNTTPETADDVADIAALLRPHRSQDETFEWLTSNLVILPFNDWLRDAVTVRQRSASASASSPPYRYGTTPVSPLAPSPVSRRPSATMAGPGVGMPVGGGGGTPPASLDLARVQRELALFFRREVARDEDIPVPTLEELGAVLGATGLPPSPVSPGSPEDAVVCSAGAGLSSVSMEDLVKRFVLALLSVNLKRGGIWEDHDRRRGYVELIVVAIRVFRHLTGLKG
ncbi:hypothetical protein F5Y19DRAFT_140674 [Xylariaceae sp. FL1651]|nr:hypothetical protein F5Y19DRAFT_140674 [Xylariaceae sp. FL1651]